MATPAAVLDVLVQANTRSAVSDLKRFDTYLNRVDKTTATATTRTSTLGKATRSTGSRLASAARYAAGAAAAYMSIAQAKEAITTTQDLAKTTAGLNRNLGFTVKEGSRWAAVAKSRDIDAKALTMSFTTLSRRVVDGAAAIREGGSAAETAMAPFERLGISQREVVKGSKDLDAFMPRLADAFGDAAGGAERQASAQQLLGRGYATVLPLFAEGAKGLQEQQHWADKYGTTLNQKTLKAQMDLVSAQRESKVAWLGIQMAFAQGVTPALEKANDVFQKIASIMADKDLTDAEKWKKVGDIIAKWADRLLDVFVKVLPQLVEHAAEAAPKIAKALIDGILNSPAIGAFLLGGWLLKGPLLGGIGRAAGALIGNPMGLAIAATAASAFAGAKLSPKILANKDSFLPMNASDGVEHLADALDITIEHAQRLANFMGNHPGFDTTESLKMMRQQSQHTMNAVKDFGREWGLTAEEIRQKTKQNFQAIRRTMGTESMEAKLAVMHNFEGAVQAIKNSMDAGEISAKRGAKMIHNILIKQLKGYGISDPEGFINRNEAVLAPGAMGGKQRGGEVMPALASGGLAAMVPGRSTGDRHTLSIDGVPKAKVESGEGVFVGNRKMMGAAAVANAAVPRFQAGGGLKPGIQALVTWAGRTLGLNVSSGLRPGDNDSFHGSGEAADFTPPSMGATKRIFASWKDQLAELFYDPWGGWDEGQMIGAIGGHIDHIHAAIRGSGGGGPTAAAAMKKLELPRFTGNFALGDVVATGLNNMAAGVESTMNKRLAKRSAAVPHADVGGGVLSRGEFTALARQAIKLTGAGGFNVAGLLTLAMAESSLDPNSQNLWDSNATAGDPSGGLMQLTGTNFRAFHEPGTANNIFDPLANIAASINYQIDRYGGQVTHSPYMRGGLLELAEGGSIPELFPQLGSREQDTRKDAQARILEKIGRFGMHPDTLTRLFQGTNALAEHQEFAGYASSSDITDANDNLIPGIFKDGTEHSWLLKAREEAWTLRENLIKADTAMRPQIEAFENKDGLIKKAERRLEQVRDALHTAQGELKDLLERIERQRDIIEDAKEKLEKKGLSDSQKKTQQDRIDTAQKTIENITGEKIPKVENAIDRATRERDALVDPVMPALAAKFEELRAIKDGIRGDSYSDEATGMGFDGLKTIQGTGSSMDLMPMPDDLQQRFGGTLNEIQQRLIAMIPVPKPGDSVIDQLEAALALAGLTPDLADDIAAQSEIVSYWEGELARLQESGAPASEIGSAADSLSSARDALASLQETTGPAGGSDTDSLKLEALMAENQRLRMSAQQAGTFAGFFRQFSAMPQFATGGVMDRTGPALVHGREGIFTPDQMKALGGRGDVVVNVNIDGMDVVVETLIDGVLAKETRKALGRGPTTGRKVAAGRRRS